MVINDIFFFPKKALLDIQPLVVKQRLVSFPVNKYRLFFFKQTFWSITSPCTKLCQGWMEIIHILSGLT